MTCLHVSSEYARCETDRPVTDSGRSCEKSADCDHWPVNRCISSLRSSLELHSKNDSFFLLLNPLPYENIVSIYKLINLQVLGCNLLPDAVTWLYTSVLKGLQMHGQHEGCNAALTQLALLIYESLVRHASSAVIILNVSWKHTCDPGPQNQS